MQLQIIQNEEIVKEPIKFIHKNFNLIDEGQKLYLRYELDKTKELRIFFKNVLLEPESRVKIKKIWDTGKGLKELFDDLWIVKSNLSGVLLFVPEKTEMSKKDGIFLLILSKTYLYPSPVYFKRSFINNSAIALFYVSNKSFIFLLGKDEVTVVVNKDEGLLCQKYIRASSKE